MERILIIDDDPGIQSLLKDYLKNQGYQVQTVGRGINARLLLQNNDVNLVMQDIDLPDVDGLEFAREIRQTYPQIGLMLLGKEDIVDCIVGLEVGADDYVAKPFNLREVLARSKSILRRLNKTGDTPLNAGHEVLSFNGWRLDTDRRIVISKDGKEVALTSGDYRLLEIFVHHPHRILSRDQLLEMVSARQWEPYDRSVDTRVRRLRAKIEPDPTHPKYIQTVRGEGYIFTADVIRL